MPLWLTLVGLTGYVPAIMYLFVVTRLAARNKSTQRHIISRSFWIELMIIPGTAASCMGIILSLSYWNCTYGRTCASGIPNLIILGATLAVFVSWLGLGLLIRRFARVQTLGREI